jgi:hypothetical protein
VSFNPNDVNYQAYLSARARLDANTADNFDQGFIEYLCAQATATGTINSAMVTTAITQALATGRRSAPTF